ncbi:MAG: TlpA disulfide reductase family protein [Bacteroidota bacterium]
MKIFLSLLVVLMSVHLSYAQKPELQPIDAEQLAGLIANHKGDKPILLNVWATWCSPCVEELPYLLELEKKYANQFELVLVSADFKEAVPEAQLFLEEQGVRFTTYLKTGKDDTFISRLSTTWTGALPFTIIFSKQGDVSSEWEGKAEFEQFEKELLKVIN